jgi:protein transport protein SEC24
VSRDRGFRCYKSKLIILHKFALNYEQEFCIRKPVPASLVFVIDASWNAVQSGMLQVACETIKEMLDLFPMDDDQTETPCKVAIVTFDKSIQFYNLSVRLPLNYIVSITIL